MTDYMWGATSGGEIQNDCQVPYLVEVVTNQKR